MNTRTRIVTSALAALTLAALAACGPAPQPGMKWLAPAGSASLPAGKVKLEIAAESWSFVDANQPAKPGEGHVHFFINVPASAVPVGQVIPTDKPETYQHAGKAPYTSRDVELKPGEYTITAVMADSEHKALGSPAPVTVRFSVK